MLKLCVVLLATFVSLSTAFGPPGYFSEFSLLRCMVANPRAGQRDQPDTKEEPIPVLPFHVVYDDFGTWFQPVTSQTRSPVLGEFSARLRDFLLEYVGSLANIQLSTAGANTPTSINNAPAGNLIPQRLRLVGGGSVGGSVGAHLNSRVSWVRIPPRAAHLFFFLCCTFLSAPFSV
jgi:hypothetical protein